MALDERSTAILEYLMRAETYVKPNELMEKFHISRRTVYYDVDKINDWLADQKMNPIKAVRSAGFLLEENLAKSLPESLTKVNSWHYEYSAKERKAWLAISLMENDMPLYLNSLMERNRVSRNTTIEDLKLLKQDLMRLGLSLVFERKKGYTINGREEDKRKALMKYLHHILPLSKAKSIFEESIYSYWLTVEINMEKWQEIRRTLGDCEQYLNIQFTDDMMDNLSLRLLLFCNRVFKGMIITIDEVEIDILRSTTEYEAARSISAKLSVLFQMNIPEEEILYITRHLLSARVQSVEKSGFVGSNADEEILLSVVNRMVTDFQKHACVVFKNRNEMEQSLLLHVKPAFYRIRYGLEMESELTASIKERYSDIYLITKKVITHLERAVGCEVNEDEIALIATHFGGWMNRVGAKLDKRMKALVVCSNGVGTSKLLMYQLELYFSYVEVIGCVSYRDYVAKQFDVDFIFSTIPFESGEKPVFVVNPILTEAEIDVLTKKVHGVIGSYDRKNRSLDGLMEIIQKHAQVLDNEGLQQDLKQYLYRPKKLVKDTKSPSLASLLPVEHIQLLEAATDWKNSIKLAAEPLLAGGFIKKDYIKSMIWNIEKMGPYIVISPKVAIPHARPEDGVNKLSMSLLKLTKEVPFSKENKHQIQLIIILAAIDGETHLKAISQLSRMFSDSDNVRKILAANTAKEIFELINIHSQ
ncbi:BglG family transcription antiterminator [Niallia taxi]|uniref:BglG family transcription antiterminator n=1 Tax=Niallia taxi TaxID=2499688 RepID=UPI00300B7D58